MIIVFSGYNQRAVIAFLRCLKQNKITNYNIIAASSADTILLTEYKSRVAYVRKNKALDLKEILGTIDTLLQNSNQKNALIVPSTEALNRFLLKNYREFVNHHCTVPLVEENLYETVSDKEKFWKLCNENSLKVPQIIQLTKSFSVPFVAKPKTYFAADGNTYSPVIVKNQQEYDDFTANYSGDDFDIQEYIEGQSFYLLYYISRSGKVYSFSQENLAQQPKGKSIVAARSAQLHKTPIAKDYEKLLKKIFYHGFIMIELREHDGNYYMIEANPRFWGPTQLYADAGVTFMEHFLEDYGYLEGTATDKENAQALYFWQGGISAVGEEHIVWYGNSQEYFKSHFQQFSDIEIYNRLDTKEIYHKENNEK